MENNTINRHIIQYTCQSCHFNDIAISAFVHSATAQPRRVCKFSPRQLNITPSPQTAIIQIQSKDQSVFTWKKENEKEKRKRRDASIRQEIDR